MRYGLTSTLVLLATAYALAAPDFPASEVSATSRPATKLLDQQTQEDLLEFRSALDEGDIIAAKLARERMKGRIPESDQELVEDISRLDRKLTEQWSQSGAKAGKGYVWVAKPSARGGRWGKGMSDGAQILKQQSRSKSTAGVLVLRIRLELPEAEQAVEVSCTDLNTFSCCWGYGSHQWVRDGEVVLLGRGYQSGVQAGTIEVRSLRHAHASLDVEIPENRVISGELYIRALPQNRLGKLRVHVVAEPGVSLDGAVVRMGRGYAPWKGGVPLNPDATCLFEDIGEGSCDVYIEKPKLLCSPHVTAEIKPGSTVDVELKAFARRRVVIDWRYRFPAGEGSWKDGSTTLLSGAGAPLNTWEQNGSAYTLGEWQGGGAVIRGMNGELLPAESADFDPPRVRADPRHFQEGGSGSYSIAVGKVFAMRYGWPERGGEGESLIRICSIEPVVPMSSQPGP
jgi:hypothetical protein